MAPSRDRETLRLGFVPDEVRVLFVGESPPAGGTFFYECNSNLYRYTKEAFSIAFEAAPAASFLHTFKGLGCYLIDLCTFPVNDLDRSTRVSVCRSAVPSLADRINQLSPRAVISTPKSIRMHVFNAISDSGIEPSHWSLPFPSMSHQRRYQSELVEVLQVLSIQGHLNARIRPPPNE